MLLIFAIFQLCADMNVIPIKEKKSHSPSLKVLTKWWPPQTKKVHWFISYYTRLYKSALDGNLYKIHIPVVLFFPHCPVK